MLGSVWPKTLGEADPTSSPTFYALNNMRGITLADLEKYRSRTFRFLPRLRLHFERDAIHFVNERGFIFFWPVKNVLLPSLWGAVAGNRPVPNNHDDPAHKTWRWKDNLLGKKKWYYARILRKRNTIISLKMLPYFYALSPNYGDPENDYLIQYEQGLLPKEAKSVYEVLLNEGPLNTLALRRASHLTSPSNASRFNHALELLQADFRILPVGIAEAGTWKYAFVYDVFHHHYPGLIETSRIITQTTARQILLNTYLKTIGACPTDELNQLFKWKEKEIEQSIKILLDKDAIFQGKLFDGDAREWIAEHQFIS
jgi:hypothetical protein